MAVILRGQALFDAVLMVARLPPRYIVTKRGQSDLLSNLRHPCIGTCSTPRVQDVSSYSAALVHPMSRRDHEPRCPLRPCWIQDEYVTGNTICNRRSWAPPGLVNQGVDASISAAGFRLFWNVARQMESSSAADDDWGRENRGV